MDKHIEAFRAAARILAAQGNTHAAIYSTDRGRLVITNEPVPFGWTLVEVFVSLRREHDARCERRAADCDGLFAQTVGFLLCVVVCFLFGFCLGLVFRF